MRNNAINWSVPPFLPVSAMSEHRKEILDVGLEFCKGCCETRCARQKKHLERRTSSVADYGVTQRLAATAAHAVATDGGCIEFGRRNSPRIHGIHLMDVRRRMSRMPGHPPRLKMLSFPEMALPEQAIADFTATEAEKRHTCRIET